MIFSENRLPPRIKSAAGFFGIMPYFFEIMAAAFCAISAGVA